MTTRIISDKDKKGFVVTEFFDGQKLKYQITQRYDDFEDNCEDKSKQVFGYVQLSKNDLKYILKKIDMEEMSRDEK